MKRLGTAMANIVILIRREFVVQCIVVVYTYKLTCALPGTRIAL